MSQQTWQKSHHLLIVTMFTRRLGLNSRGLSSACCDRDLHGNYLEGRVTPELLNSFPRLSSLDISSNYLTGTVPISKIPNLKNNYTWAYNCFSSDTDCHLEPMMRSISDCQQHTSFQLQPCTTWAQNHLLMLMVILLVCPFASIAFLSGIAFYHWRKRSVQTMDFWQLKSSMRTTELQEEPPFRNTCCKQFTYQELEAATNCFHPNCLIRAGNSGFVYQGKLEDNCCNVAIKQLDTQKSGVLINEEFWNEITHRGSVQHPNVVTLRGFFKGVAGNGPMLVCDYMPNGSVLDALLNDATPLRWPRRFSIIYGAAAGLEFLHEHCLPPIIHGNLKPSNILLDRYVKHHHGAL